MNRLSPLVLHGLEPADLRALSAAVRADRPVELDLRSPAPPGVRLDEIAPLLRRARAVQPVDADALALGRPPAPTALPPGAPDARVAAVIPTHRQSPLGLPAFLRQDLPVRVLVLSNGPGGPAALPGAEVLRVPWRGHGETRQAALDAVDEPYVLYTVDDAVPCGAGFVRVLVESLEASGADAVVARQVPWPDADPVTRARLRKWTPPGTEVVPFPQCDHVATLYRTETLRRWPLPSVPTAEDLWWSRGRRVVLAPMAAVVHSHRRRPLELYRRNQSIHTERVRMGLPPTVGSLASASASLPGLLRPLGRGNLRETANQLAELLGQWHGSRAGRRHPQGESS